MENADLVGVLSILEGPALAEAQRLWALFATEYHSQGAQSFDFPNVTFQVGYCRDLARLENALFELSRQISPFEMIIHGLGHFAGPSKAVYLKVEPTETLRQINRAVNDMLVQHCDEVVETYRPALWIPHVTVAMDDLTEENFQRAMQEMRNYHPQYRQVLHNICLVQKQEPTGRIVMVRRFTCGAAA